MALPVLVLLVLAAGAIALLIRGSGSPAAATPVPSTQSTKFAGLAALPLRAAPALSTLRNYDGGTFNLAADRGKVVFVTFLYTNCPTDCPLIAAKLHSAISLMGSKLAARVRLVAVSVDPHGDTPANVRAFLRVHGLSGRMQYLLGTAHQLAPVWARWYVGSSRDTSNPELVNHTAIIYGITASGKLATIYADTDPASSFVHDVKPLLAG